MHATFVANHFAKIAKTAKNNINLSKAKTKVEFVEFVMLNTHLEITIYHRRWKQ